MRTGYGADNFWLTFYTVCLSVCP